MSIPTRIDVAQFDDLIDRFTDEIGAHTWRQRCEKNVKACQRNPLLADYLNEEFAIPHALELCARAKAEHGSLVPMANGAHWMYPAMSFASQALFMISQTSAATRRSMTGRIADAIADNDAMRAFLLELGTATHFARRGLRVVWPELEGIGTFDLLLPELGKLGLEFECKSISPDKGRRITREEAINFYGCLYQRLLQYSAEIKGHRAIRVTVPSRLPTSDIELPLLADAVFADIQSGGQGVVRPSYELTMRHIPDEEIYWQGDPLAPNLTRERIEDFTGTKNRELAIIGTPGKAVVLLAIQSAKSDHLLKSIYDVLSDAAKRQLTKTRPGILILGLSGVDSEALIRLAGQDEASSSPSTSLARAAERFLDAPHRAHVVGLSFKGRSILSPGPGYVDSGGAAYHFSNPKAIFWEDAFRGLFRPSMRE